MSWDVHIGHRERNVTFNFSPLFRTMMPGGLSQLHGVTAEEAATIIWHGFKSASHGNEGGEHVMSFVTRVGTSSSTLTRGSSTIEQGLSVLRELWQVCIEANPAEKVLVFG
jgi:hypothetical protein